MSSMKPSNPLPQLWKSLAEFRFDAVRASIYSVLNTLFDIMPEILIGMAINVVVSKEQSFLAQLGIEDPWQQILALGALSLFIWMAESLFEYLYLLGWRNLAQKVQHRLRIRCYAKMQELDLGFFEEENTGNLLSILNDDINQLHVFLDIGIHQILNVIVVVIGVGSVFFYLSPQIALVAFTPVPAILFGAIWFQTRANPIYARLRQQVGLLASRINNNLGGMLTIRTYNRENFELQVLEKDSLAYLEANEKAIRTSSAFIPVIRMAILCGFIGTFVWGAHLVIEEQLAVGSYGVLVFLTQRLLWPLTNIGKVLDTYERAMASSRRILAILHTPIEIGSGQQVCPPTPFAIEISHLHFRYASGKEVLKGIHLKIEPGTTTALVGSTGSGKSSLAKLLLRFYEAQEGQIRIDGIDIRDLQVNSLRQHIAFVSQEVYLFHGSVRENLLYGKADASPAELERACRKAEAWNFIQQLPEGLDTVIGERGVKLSGGQRQRIALARALLKESQLLILDEATSAIDTETERAIQKSLRDLAKTRSLLVIAHRLSTVVEADQICVMNEGQIVARGSHAELLEKSELYRKLWQA